MSRVARKDFKTPFLHIMVQGINKEYIFENNKYIEKYINIIDTINEKHNLTIIAYCIMNNHAHFLIYSKDIYEISKFIQKTNLIYANYYNKEKNRVGVLFRNRFKAEGIYDIKYLINCINYIHNNPVKAKIVSRCEDYKYSSYKDYIENKGITKSKIMKEMFGERCDYLKLFNETYEKRFIDTEKDTQESTDYYMAEGIREYKKVSNREISEILSNREVLKELIKNLHENNGFKYIEIRNYLKIPIGVMDKLKK